MNTGLLVYYGIGQIVECDELWVKYVGKCHLSLLCSVYESHISLFYLRIVWSYG